MAIRVDPNTRLGNLALRLAAWLAGGLVMLLGRTCRVEVVAGQDQLDSLLMPRAAGEEVAPGSAARPPVVVSFWHQRSVLAAYILCRFWVPRGLRVTVLASHSRDGGLVGHLARQWRLPLVRGSASRGGAAALRNVYRALGRGSSPVMIPDGPSGPERRFKVGVAVLAQMSGRPILPFGFAASRAWHLGSWDGLLIPKPFSRIVVLVGTPQYLPRDIGAERLEAERARLEALLDELSERADRAVP